MWTGRDSGARSPCDFPRGGATQNLAAYLLSRHEMFFPLSLMEVKGRKKTAGDKVFRGQGSSNPMPLSVVWLIQIQEK
jgi:hypothetical protein